MRAFAWHLVDSSWPLVSFLQSHRRFPMRRVQHRSLFRLSGFLSLFLQPFWSRHVQSFMVQFCAATRQGGSGAEQRPIPSHQCSVLRAPKRSIYAWTGHCSGQAVAAVGEPPPRLCVPQKKPSSPCAAPLEVLVREIWGSATIMEPHGRFVTDPRHGLRESAIGSHCYLPHGTENSGGADYPFLLPKIWSAVAPADRFFHSYHHYSANRLTKLVSQYSTVPLVRTAEPCARSPSAQVGEMARSYW